MPFVWVKLTLKKKRNQYTCTCKSKDFITNLICILNCVHIIVQLVGVKIKVDIQIKYV